MQARRKLEEPLTPEKSLRSELDDALEGAAAVLRARGRHAFALGEEGADDVRRTYEQWAKHLLVRSAPPGDSEPSRDGRREWKRLERFVATVSVGIAQVRSGDGSVELVARADRALHEAKRAGRDRFVVAR